ncbi:MAG: flagellar motor switch protein FliN [Hydrogenophaga sp.]|uniref:flagellar motor switch protein FliN n=1 Tax=Hydrogenophaga sp. TaxID=1904254 RepID=UPI003D9AC3BA
MSTDTTDTMNQDSIADDWAQALEEQAASEAGQADSAPAFDSDTPHPPAASSGLGGSGGGGGGGGTGAAAGANGGIPDIQMVLDIPVTLSVELGRVKVPIKYILQLAQGSVVELDALAGEPMDVLVNGYLIAQGEVVVVNDKFGIRLTDIVTPSERMRRVSRS